MVQPLCFRRLPGVLLLLFLTTSPLSADWAVGEQWAVPVGPSAAVLEPSLGLGAALGLVDSGGLSADLASRWHWFRTKAPVGALLGSLEAQGSWSLPAAPAFGFGLGAGAGFFAACRTDLTLPVLSGSTSAEVFGTWEGSPAFSVRVSLGWQAYWGLTQAVVLAARYELGGGS